jgi:hypothetical protein
MGVDRSRPGRRRDRQYADPRQKITGLCHHLRDRQRRGLLGGRAATTLPCIYINLHGLRGFFSLSTRLTLIARAILLLTCHPLTERWGRLADR